MRKLFLAGSAGLLTLAFACDLEKTGNQLQAKKVMVATLLATPPVDISPLAIAGFDGGTFDGGSFDAGGLLDGGVVTVPGQTVAFVFFGTRTSEGLDSAPEAISNASVNTRPAGGAPTELTNDGSGKYSKNSAQDSAFKYEPAKTYEFEAKLSGESFVAEVTDAPALERINALHPPKGYLEQTANTPFTFTRPDPPAGKERNLGFVNVVPLDSKGSQGEPTYSNIPTTPLLFLKLVALPSDWKQTTVTIPATAFPQANKNYLIIFQSVKTGGPKSDNLFTGSAILAGTADIGVVKTR